MTFAIAAVTLTVAIPVAIGSEEPFAIFSSSGEAPFVTSLNAAESSAENDGDVDPVEVRFLKLQSELDQLKAALAAQPTNPAAADKNSKTSKSPAPVTYPTVKLGGFFQVDAGWFQQDANSIAELGDIQDNRGFRRTRLGASGKVAENVSYLLEMDFALVGRPSFRDVRMDISSVPLLGNVRVGVFRQPFGMDELTSAREITFLERSSLQGLAPFRQTGIAFHDTNSSETVTWMASAFGSATDPWGNSVGDRGYGIASRITTVLAEDKGADILFHGGLGYSFLNERIQRFLYRNNQEYSGPVGLPDSVPYFANTGLIPAENANLFNAELASTWGSWHAQSELRYNLLNLNSGGVAGFPSFYAQTGLILTGEHRPYNKTTAVLGHIKPKEPVGISGGGIGAWELACRYSILDLNDGVITGGKLQNTTFGLNWYLNDFTRLQFNFIYSDLNRAPVGESHANIFAIRAQVEF